MEVELSDSKPSSCLGTVRKGNSDKDRFCVKRKNLQAVIEQCRRAFELLNTADGEVDEDDEGARRSFQATVTADEHNPPDLSSLRAEQEANQFCDLLKYGIECPDFLEKLETAHTSVTRSVSEEVNSWDLISDNDLWDTEGGQPEDEDYVLVTEDDIVDGIACFMAACLLSLKQTKDLTPYQIQEGNLDPFLTECLALSKAFSVKRKKGKLHKAWDGSKVIYNVASWGATAIGIYQNPLILRAATKAFWTSFHVMSKLL